MILFTTLNDCSSQCNANTHALIVSDMPFLSYHVSVEDTIRNAGRIVKEGGAEAVKLEGGCSIIDQVKAIIDAQIPVMGHLGLTPQSVNAFGGFKVQGRDEENAKRILDDALALQDAGVFSIVLEGIPETLAKEISSGFSSQPSVLVPRYCDDKYWYCKICWECTTICSEIPNNTPTEQHNHLPKITST